MAHLPALPYFLNGQLRLGLAPEVQMTCEICKAALINEQYIEHMEKCTEGSNVAYYLKMAMTQQNKTSDFNRILFLRYCDMNRDEPLLLPKGICYYCDTPEQHRNKHCHQATRVEYFKKMREKVTPDHIWSINMQYEFLKKAQLEVLAFKHRGELEPFYKKFVTERQAFDKLEQVAPDAVEWPVNSICQEVQATLKRHTEELEERKRQLDDFFKEHSKETLTNRDGLYNGLQANLKARDKFSPETKWAFI